MNGIHKQFSIPEDLLNSNGLSLHSSKKLLKTGGEADDLTGDSVSSKAAIADDDDDKLQEYLKRSDTAVIYAEPVGRPDAGECYSVVLNNNSPRVLLNNG
jgi:hypothetical protein